LGTHDYNNIKNIWKLFQIDLKLLGVLHGKEYENLCFWHINNVHTPHFNYSNFTLHNIKLPKKHTHTHTHTHTILSYALSNTNFHKTLKGWYKDHPHCS